ncbi:receptor-type tyrosine-protein phosphatase eta-like isoform X2 [Carassius carassius]|uniref:receptor-type tyrosine-protein phosphatase eta-like isoform X2 n=1 Tax=Carassius carassius TaxID=217509 RepID=UPI00286840EC|nr:receptor-type tyrosine-protein phosphatase eta-like isoform X2 [Carassius carassius]
MGVLQYSVFRATVLSFAVLVSIPQGHSDCAMCQYKIIPTTSDITIFVGDSSSCSVQNTNITSTPNSITVTGLQPGNTYFLKINCSDVCCANFSTSPAQVENITVLNSSNSSLTVGWPVPLGHVDSYIVNVSGAELNTPLNLTTFTNSSVISNLMAGRVYNLTVTTISGVLKNSSNIVLVATKPNPPEAVRVSGQTNVSISLLWLKPLSMDAVCYEVSYRSNQSGVNLTLNHTNSLNATLTNLLPGSQYDLTVVSIGVKELRSSNVNLTAYTAPNAVQNLSISAVGTISVNLNWLPPIGTLSLFSYSINISPPDQTLNTTSNNYQITQLQPGTQYNCSVRALIITAYIFGPSQLIQCNTKPLPVTNLTASPVGTTQMSLSWSRQSDYKSSYQYNVSVNGEQWIQSINETTNVVNLIAGNNYTFTVQTVANGMSSESVAISAFTGLGKASNISAVSTTQSMRVEWRPPDGIVSLYNVKILLNGTVLKMENRTNETTVVFSDLLPGTQYNVIVTSISGPMKQDSDSVSNATLPTPPGEFVTMQSTNSLNISWARPLNMSSVSHYFQLSYSNSTLNCSQNYSSLTGLDAGVQYNITVRTVGAMGYFSSPQFLTAYTNPTAVTDVRLNEYTETSISLSWLQLDVQQSGYSYRLSFTHPNGTADQKTVNNRRAQLLSLQSASQYNISIITQTAGGTKSYPQFITAHTKPFPVSSVTYNVVNVSAVKLSWSRPQEYPNGFSYQVLVSNCTENSRNLSTFSENIIVPDLLPGTLCQFSLYSLAYGILGEPVNISVFTKPSTVVPQLDNQGSNESLLVTWDRPVGGLDMYILNITSEEGWNSSKVLNSTERNYTFSQLKAATIFTVTLTTVKADFWETSHSVNMATYPNRPGEITILLTSNHSVWFQWDEAENMSDGSFSYTLTCWLSFNTSQYLTANNTFLLDGLHSGTSYNVSVATVGPMGFQSGSIRVQVTTKPSTVVPQLDNQGSNESLLVTWDRPVGGLDMYILNITSEEGWNSSKVLNSTERNYTFSQLKAATIFTVTLTTVKADFWETSHSVNMATYPNRPGEITILLTSNHSVWFQWDEAENMSDGSFSYTLTCWLSFNTSQYLTANNTFLLDGLHSGTSYNVSVATVGPMGFQSGSIRVQVTTKPDPVQNVQLGSTSTNTISVIWAKVEGVPKYLVRVYSEKVENNLTSTNNSMTIYNLMPSTLYNISVQSSTSDNTEGEAVWLQACTDAAPVENVTCTGPNLTLPMLTLSWSPPLGENLDFEVKLNSNSEKTISLNHTFIGLKFNTLYNVMLWTLGCGKKSEMKSIVCMTGITKPVVPQITSVIVSDLQYNKFTLILQSDVFNDSNGPVLYYGVLVYSGTIDCLDKSNKLDRCLLNTYNDWKAKLCSTFLAVVKQKTGSTSVQIGDGTEWNGYKNGELNAKASYNFAVIAFTRLEINNSLLDVSNSYYSISKFYQSPITLPENPVVIGAAAGVGVAALLVVIIIGVVVCRQKQSKDENTSVPIHSIRQVHCAPIKVEDYEAYYKKHRADSFCGFAEEFEDLRPVGINQSKTVAQAPENKAKNRYNNVLPYDSSRVKLSVLSSPFDDYINANYMPGYTSKKEFIAAQGPLPCTVDDFWRLIWEKNVHTIVMLTKCNEQGRVKCEEYWPAETKHFINLTVMSTSEITLEDWTLRDFEVKNVKTAESRSVRHFHFTAWPDHGVPETTELLINFRHLVREHMDQFSRHSPTLVHCSAGVGRTGTFIAIDRLIFQIEREGVVDVYGIIHDLRMHRPLMVQTEDQYVFLNQCAMDIIKSRTGNNVDLIYQNTAALTIYENFEPLKKAKNGYHNA